MFCYIFLLVLALVLARVLLLLISVEVMLLAAVLMRLPARHCFVKQFALVVPIILA